MSILAGARCVGCRVPAPAHQIIRHATAQHSSGCAPHVRCRVSSSRAFGEAPMNIRPTRGYRRLRAVWLTGMILTLLTPPAWAQAPAADAGPAPVSMDEAERRAAAA